MEWRRNIPLRYEADVAVVGAGMAGVAAACAAARGGASVVLVERFGVTGGNATAGGVASFCGENAGQGAIFDEILRDLEAWDAIAPYAPFTGKGGARIFDHEILAVVLQEIILRYGVKLVLHTRFVDVRVSHQGRITEAVVCGQSGPEALRAAVWIDCTGDGAVAHMAGFSTMKGRAGDGLQLPMSHMFFVREMDEPQPAQKPEAWFVPIEKQADLPMTSPWPNGPRGKAIKIKIPCFDASDTESLTAAEIAARRRMWEVLDFYQRHTESHWRFDHSAAIIGIREGRRIVGDTVLTEEDCRSGRTFDDGVVRGSFYLDGHSPDDDKRTYILPLEDLVIPPYQIPLRALLARDGENLLMAGRCLSAEQLALSSARVMTTCAMMGQAVGITAAMATADNKNIRDVKPTRVVAELIRYGANLDCTEPAYVAEHRTGQMNG